MIQTYKEQCKVVYSQVKCDIKNIDTMNITELYRHLKHVKSLYNKSRKCYEYRQRYTEQCIKDIDRDRGHDHAIKKALKYYHICQTQLVKVSVRIQELKETMRKAESLLQTLEDTEQPWEYV